MKNDAQPQHSEFEEQAHHDGSMTPEVRATLIRSALTETSPLSEQAWTPELTWEIARDAIVDKQVRKVVDNAHNAALAAEHRKVEEQMEFRQGQEERHKRELAAEHTNAEAWRLTCKGKEGAYVKMEQQLATEREKLEGELANGTTLFRQLLQAQAAIAKINKLTLDYVRSDLALQQIRIWSHEVDLSLLKQYDAEVRKPLVDLLKRIQQHDDSSIEGVLDSDLRSDIDNAVEQL